jgi:hypothetical protein
LRRRRLNLDSDGGGEDRRARGAYNGAYNCRDDRAYGDHRRGGSRRG